MKITSTPVSNFNNSFTSANTKKESLKTDPPSSKELPPKHQATTEESVEKLKQAITSFNEIFKPTHLEFQIHDEAGRYFVKIVDDKTQNVIKQIPSEEFLEMIAEAKNQLGLLMDTRV